MKEQSTKLELKGKLLKKLLARAKRQGFEYSPQVYARILLAKALRIKWSEAIKNE